MIADGSAIKTIRRAVVRFELHFRRKIDLKIDLKLQAVQQGAGQDPIGLNGLTTKIRKYTSNRSWTQSSAGMVFERLLVITVCERKDGTEWWNMLHLAPVLGHGGDLARYLLQFDYSIYLCVLLSKYLKSIAVEVVPSTS